MRSTLNCLVFDLGAESGRALLARFDGRRLILEEVHRFPNGPVRILESLHWDALRLFAEMKVGLTQACRFGAELSSLGIDTWGVDFGLLDSDGELLGNPWHYRDARTNGMMEEAFLRVPRDEIYGRTGIQFMQLNSLYQLLAMSMSGSAQLAAARTLLFMPDLFNYWFSTSRTTERTIASTSQCVDAQTGTWARDLLERLGIPVVLLPEIVAPGTVVGSLNASVREETGAGTMKVVAPGCHDTASAVAAVPATGSRWAYVSSGTWSLMGVESGSPVLSRQALDLNFTNEAGVEGKTRLLKNIIGLWLVQECRRTWAASGIGVDYADLAAEAAAAKPFQALVDPDAPEFLAPGDMPFRIREFCRRTAQPVPVDRGATMRCVLESLALKYRRTLDSLERLAGYRVDRLHIVGGGSQNRLLNQFTADATGTPVVTGPVEATAAGNALVQLIALGEIGGLEEGRELVKSSFETTSFEPTDPDQWESALDRFDRLAGRAAG